MRKSRPSSLALALALAGCGTVADDIQPPADQSAPADLAMGDARSDGPQTNPTATVIRVHYPTGGRALSIRGSVAPLNWNGGQPMVQGQGDTWTWQSDQVMASLEWKPLLDDATWSRGPNYVVEPGATTDEWPHFTATQGMVVDLLPGFHSQRLPGNDRDVWAYLPPTYAENTRATFPVVYMHDGQNLFDPTRAFGGNEWMVDETMDAAAEDGSIREAVVIGIDNTAARIYEYTPTVDATVGDGGGGDLYLALIADELKPVIDATVRTRPAPADTAILGSSLGGLISSYAGVKRAETFGLIGAMSPSTWWDSDVIIADVTGRKGLLPRPIAVYLDSGDSGTMNDDLADTNLLASAYLAGGFVEGVDFHHVVQAGGQHNEIYWAERLPGALAFLLGPRPP